MSRDDEWFNTMWDARATEEQALRLHRLGVVSSACLAAYLYFAAGGDE